MRLIINWNGLYRTQPWERVFARYRIRRHYRMKNLGRRQVIYADVRYVLLSSFSLYLYIYKYARPTGWHGEGGAERIGGHLTVRFWKRGGGRSGLVFYATHHVYSKNSAYGELESFICFYLTNFFSV